ncbi:MAG: SoxR reducing system RseC family protein [Calditrichaeota bacterium]|nr:SoxR reducing system RseC family protein [Calditrichota bacterium]
MEETGIIREVHGDEAVVELTPVSSCSSCALHSVCNPSEVEKPVLTATNPIHAREGDWVKLEMNPGAAITSAFLIFIFPLLGLAVGYVAGHAFGRLAEIIGSVLGFALFLLVVKFLDPVLTKKRAFKPIVIQVLSNSLPLNIEIKDKSPKN